MNIVAIIQARMGSSRLPGKVSMDLGGETVLGRVVRRLQRSRHISKIVVATTTVPADEVIVAVHIPAQPAESRGVYLKLMDRQAWAYALVSAAAQMTLTDGRVERARLALGGVANTPRRAPAAEALLEGQPLTPALAAQAAERAVEGAKPLAHNGYKVQMARELARRAILEAAGMPW